MKQPKIRTGLDILRDEDFAGLKDLRLGLLTHPASIDAQLNHAVGLFHASENIDLVRLFGPQHGILGETQDNMIEWEGFIDPVSRLKVHSLYGEHRKPTPDMLKGLDALVIDLQDVGSRVYTFNWTALLCLRACAEQGCKVVVLDRPNPIIPFGMGGPLLDMAFESFVGMAPIPLQHGLTTGELLTYCNRTFDIGADLEVIWMDGGARSMWFEDTGLPWVFPSPNLPTMDSLLVYPGFVLFEGTNLSEGRGTTRPFELFGAPYIDPHALIRRLEGWELPGARFRPLHFQPTFQKWENRVCGGAQVYAADRTVFRPVLTALAVLCAARELWPKEFAWKHPPYEYEHEKLPIDILAGSESLRRDVDAGKTPYEIAGSWNEDLVAFEKSVAEFQRYT
ncbi:MAG: DUF1343 domain-containing protein [Elusimicrobiota bacterium]